jgi:capsular polysaccharide biosynthesis protein
MRKHYLHDISNAIVEHPRYPICRVNGQSPYDEQVMSMPSIMAGIGLAEQPNATTFQKGHFFFFIFNLDNYYHFIYDTLPYLTHYFELIKRIPACKLLIPESHTFLPFQLEFLTRLGITESQIVRSTHLCSYEHLYLPSSLTHGKDASGTPLSNEIYSPEARTLWNRLRPSIKIYISRRTHIHNDMTNIGTNYTLRRRCINEDAVVSAVSNRGYKEIFCELLTTDEKIELFARATHIIGFIGGGLANLLFSRPETQVGCIETPDFLRINQRFKHSMDHTRITYLPITKHSAYDGPYSLYTRVRIITGPYKDRIGELLEWKDGQGYRVNVSNNDIAGFAHNQIFTEVWISDTDLDPLDKGLNSPFECDIHSLNCYLDSLEE